MRSLKMLLVCGVLVGAAPVLGDLTPEPGDLTSLTQDPVLTFGFKELDGDYAFNGVDGGAFTAVASSFATGGPYDTSGNVHRIHAPQGFAEFNTGFFGLSPANVVFSMQITGVTASNAFANGSFAITDVNGDQIVGRMSGSWNVLGGNFGSFRGLIDEASTQNNSGDGNFDGPSGGSFSLAFPFPQLTGAIIFLETGSWFNSSFSNTDTQVQASVIGIPEPTAAVLGILGLSLVSRFRKLSAA